MGTPWTEHTRWAIISISHAPAIVPLHGTQYHSCSDNTAWHTPTCVENTSFTLGTANECRLDSLFNVWHHYSRSGYCHCINMCIFTSHKRLIFPHSSLIERLLRTFQLCENVYDGYFLIHL